MNPRILQTVRVNTLSKRPVPHRRWIVPSYIQDRTVTILGGDGGTGKSLIMLQLSVAMATASSWLGLPVTPGGTIYFSAEDELDEIHRRLDQICDRAEVQMDDLTQMEILPLAGRDAVLAFPDRVRSTMQTTPLWERLREFLTEARPKLLVIDTLADVFGGDEINRLQTRAFIGLLRGLALEFDLAVVLLAHPSLSGITSGSGSSGSTGWSNSVRSRLYFERIKEDGGDGNGRILSSKKANYAAIGAQVRVWWRHGVFEIEDGSVPLEEASALKASEAKIDAQFLNLLTTLVAQGRSLSPNPSATYAPTIFEAHVDARGTKAKAFAGSMDRLLKRKAIHIAQSGPPSKRRSQLMPGPGPDLATDRTSTAETRLDRSLGADGKAPPATEFAGAA
jgi:RecA-family ATPase